MTVHLVNLTNPMMMKGPFRELIPVGEQQVRLRLPAGKTPRACAPAGQRRRAALPPDRRMAGARRCPSILAHEVIAVDLA